MPTKTMEQELLDLEKEYWQAIKDKDVATAMRLTDDECIITGAQGVSRIDKKALASMMKAASYTLNDFRVSDAQVRFMHDDIAALAYQVHEELTVEGKNMALDAADASVWLRRHGLWVCALHTESIRGDGCLWPRPSSNCLAAEPLRFLTCLDSLRMFWPQGLFQGLNRVLIHLPRQPGSESLLSTN